MVNPQNLQRRRGAPLLVLPLLCRRPVVHLGQVGLGMGVFLGALGLMLGFQLGQEFGFGLVGSFLVGVHGVLR
jgi:hypothetical protein